MKKTSLLLASIATIGLLASCGETPSEAPATSETPATTVTPTTSETPAMTREDADAKVATFEKEVSGKIKLTYKANYKMDVETENVGAKGFARDIRDITTAELDLTEGNLYAHIKRVGREALKEEEDKTLEALVYKEGEKYYFLKNTSADPLALPSEEAARAKIDELLKATSSREGGYIDTKTLVYEGVNTYEHRAFHLSSTNILEEDMDDPVSYAINEANGLTVKSEPTYVGYGTDQGVSDLHAAPGAFIEVNTNEKGAVTSFTETYNNAELVMPIFEPAPILRLTGTRELAATYGAEFERLGTIEHKRTTGTLNFTENKKGDVKVFTCAPNDFQHMTLAKSGDAVDVDYWICIKATPYGNNTIKAVLHNNSGTTLVDPAMAGGFYCFAVVEGDNMISVAFEGNDTKPGEVVEYAKVSVTVDPALEGVEAKNFVTFAGISSAANQTPVTDLTKLDANQWIAFQIVKGDKVLTEADVDVTIVENGETKKLFFFPTTNQFCKELKETVEYKITVAPKAETPAPEVTEVATVTVTSKDEGVKAVKLASYDLSNPAVQEVLKEDGKAPAGETKYVAITVTCADGKVVDTVKANGVDVPFQYGGYQLNVKEAVAYNIVITTKAAPVEA